MFQGKVSRTSHDGGLLVEYSGSSPALNTVMVNSRGDYVGKVKGVIGNLKQSYVHLHNLERSIDPDTLIGASQLSKTIRLFTRTRTCLGLPLAVRQMLMGSAHGIGAGGRLQRPTPF